MKYQNTGMSIKKKKIKSNMTKVIENNMAEILTLIVFVLVMTMTSCQTVKEITMSDSKRMTQCNYVNR